MSKSTIVKKKGPFLKFFDLGQKGQSLSRKLTKASINVCLLFQWNFYFFPFFHHKTMKWNWLSPYFKFSVYSYWLLCTKLKIFKYSSSYTIQQHELHQDPGKGNVIADSVITTTPIAFIFTRHCLFSMFYQFI